MICSQDVALTKGSTFDNAAHLAPSFLAAIKQRYENTRLGRQELHAELLTDTPGALWRMEQIDATRLPAEGSPLWLNRIVVAVDPAVSPEGSDETGIVACGIDEAGRFYVIDDQSGRYAPHEWAQRAINTYHRWSADRIVIEANQGGTMVEATLRHVDPHVPIRMVHASRGKVTRAEPVSALYEQGRASHVGSFPQLEDQMCAFTSDFNRNTAGYSPDRVDALVWALTSLSGPELPTFTSGEENYKAQRINLNEQSVDAMLRAAMEHGREIKI